MVSLKLKSLESYSTFADIVREKASTFINALAQGQIIDNGAANLEVYWSYEDLTVPAEREAVKRFYDMLGLTSKTKFAKLYTDASGTYDRLNVWLPAVCIDPNTNQLALYVGFNAIPITHDLKDNTFHIPVYTSDSSTPIMEQLDVTCKEVKSIAGKELTRAVFTLSLNDDDDNYFEFPIRLIDNDNDALAKVINKKAKGKETAKLIQANVAVSKLSGDNDICDINKLLLPVFQSGQFKSAIIPFTGWSFKPGTEKSPYPKIHLSVNTAQLVELYGDYKVIGFKKDEVNVSKIKKVSLSTTSSSAEYFVRNTKGTDFIPYSGLLVITAPNKRIDFAPAFMIQPAESLPAELLAKFGLKSNATPAFVSIGDNKLAIASGKPVPLPNMASSSEIAEYEQTRESDEYGVDAITYDDLEY